ncbi:hypothetical protein [Rhodococcus qingshengii]|uniref:hypothetical protein n=1 Tax=Rhodococcus qingshengii TaxID=334542 RepID=UPI0015D50E14|nr:hypothetical protein [Rhodococcus qingshengii]
MTFQCQPRGTATRLSHCLLASKDIPKWVSIPDYTEGHPSAEHTAEVLRMNYRAAET